MRKWFHKFGKRGRYDLLYRGGLCHAAAAAAVVILKLQQGSTSGSTLELTAPIVIPVPIPIPVPVPSLSLSLCLLFPRHVITAVRGFDTWNRACFWCFHFSKAKKGSSRWLPETLKTDKILSHMPRRSRRRRVKNVPRRRRGETRKLTAFLRKQETNCNWPREQTHWAHWAKWGQAGTETEQNRKRQLFVCRVYRVYRVGPVDKAPHTHTHTNWLPSCVWAARRPPRQGESY